MFELAIFALFLVLVFVAALEVLVQRTLFKAAIALAIVFAGIAGFVLVANQALFSLLQLLVLVGGLSTYLIVAVASDREVSFRHVDLRALIIVFLLIWAPIIYAVWNYLPAQNMPANPDPTQEILVGLALNFGFLFAVVFAMFAVALGSIIIIKRVVRLA